MLPGEGARHGVGFGLVTLRRFPEAPCPVKTPGTWWRLLVLAAVVAGPGGAPGALAQSMTFTSGVRTFVGLTNTDVTVTQRCELRLTGAPDPIPGCVIRLASPEAFLVLANLKPSVVAGGVLGRVRIGDAAAVADANCRVVAYGGAGTIVVPHGTTFEPMRLFHGPHFTGPALGLRRSVAYRGAGLGDMNGGFSSFRLERGYAATVAQNADGSGASRNYVAQDGPLDVGVLPAALDQNARFVYVVPWRWAAKKGIAGNIEGPLNVQWKYNWNLDQNSTRDLEYVPIRQNRWWPDLPSQNWAGRGATTLLGYNEPDRPDQANLSVADALAAWPDLLATGLRVGAPAVSDGGRGGWLYPFMNQADAAGLRVDFVPVHYYWCHDPADPAGAASQMYGFLKEVYDTTRRPVWITEWNNGANWTGCADPSPAQQQACVAAMVDMLESTPFVERYALYNWVEDARRLVWDNGTLTAAGVTYRDRVSALAYLQAAPDNGTRGIAQYRFDGDALDATGFGNHGVAWGSPIYATGRRGEALRFDGTNTTVSLPPNLAGGSAFTFAAWVYWIGGGGNWQRIFDFGNSTTQYLFLTPGSGSGTLRFAIKNGGAEQIVETAGLTPNQWRHVAVTLSGSTARLYVDGTLVQAGTGFSILPSAIKPRVNFLGRSQFVADPLFKGLLDDVVIADTAMSAGQIAALKGNAAPQFASRELTSPDAVQGQAFAGSVAGTATDEDGSALVYSKATGPAWLTVNADGSLAGTPTGANAGANDFTIRVIDAAGASDFAVLSVRVNSPLPAGPAMLARYPFEGNAKDATISAFHGTTAGAPGYLAGRFGSALNLDGTNDFVTLPRGLWAGVSNFTVAAWVYWNGGEAWQRIFDCGSDTTHYLHLSPQSGNGTLRFAIRNGGAEQTLDTGVLAKGLWQHVAVTKDGATCRIYRNGGLAATSGSVTLSPANFSPTLNFLGRSQFADPLLNARLDEVYVFNYALSASEVARLRDNLPPPPRVPPQLELTWRDGALELAWPTNYLGERLESKAVGGNESAGWVTWPDSTNATRVSVPVDRAAPGLWFRLAYP